MKITRLLALSSLSLALLVGGCRHIPYGKQQEAEILDHWSENVGRGFQPTNLPYWNSYTIGWREDKRSWSHFFENVKRGWRADRYHRKNP